MQKIVVIGEILVEIMAETPGEGFLHPQPLIGPFPSGAPAIFADQAARLGQPVGIVSAVGEDDFGRLNVERLKGDGVDVSAVGLDPDRPTGSAFVRYRKDGARDFVFNIKHSAAGHLRLSDAASALFESADHVHVMGSSLSSKALVDLNLNAVSRIRARGGTVSFDPNLRKEMLSTPGLAEAMHEVLSSTDLFLPSGDELTLLTEAVERREALAELFGRGVRAVVHKKGAAGASYSDARQSFDCTAVPVEEIDPTGAGDCFGATFVVLWLRGMSPQQALRHAAVAGALAVTRRGPMEGTSDLATIAAFLRDRGESE